MAYFGYDDRFGCRVADEGPKGPKPSEEEVKAAIAARELPAGKEKGESLGDLLRNAGKRKRQ